MLSAFPFQPLSYILGFLCFSYILFFSCSISQVYILPVRWSLSSPAVTVSVTTATCLSVTLLSSLLPSRLMLILLGLSCENTLSLFLPSFLSPFFLLSFFNQMEHVFFCTREYFVSSLFLLNFAYLLFMRIAWMGIRRPRFRSWLCLTSL